MLARFRGKLDNISRFNSLYKQFWHLRGMLVAGFEGGGARGSPGQLVSMAVCFLVTRRLDIFYSPVSGIRQVSKIPSHAPGGDKILHSDVVETLLTLCEGIEMLARST